MKLRLAALACLALSLWLPACGGGDGSDTVSESSVRECLAAANIRARAQPDTGAGVVGYAPLYAVDFTAYASDGTAVDVLVQGSQERAERTATHVRAGIAGLGVSGEDAADRVLSGGNVVAIFQGPTSAATRAAVRACLA